MLSGFLAGGIARRWVWFQAGSQAGPLGRTLGGPTQRLGEDTMGRVGAGPSGAKERERERETGMGWTREHQPVPA